MNCATGKLFYLSPDMSHTCWGPRDGTILTGKGQRECEEFAVREKFRVDDLTKGHGFVVNVYAERGFGKVNC